MQPLAQLPDVVLGGVRGVLADLDETLTTHGRLTVEAYAALTRLHGAGLCVGVVTGRSAGWCDQIARTWPVDAVVAENGGLWFARREGRVEKRYVAAAGERAGQHERLRSALAQVLAQVPGARAAADQPYRETDIAIDWNEDVPRLPEPDVERALAVLQAAGARTTRSNVHLHATFGDHDKLTTSALALGECFDIDLGAMRDALIFVGDSQNDAPMFRFFTRTSVGVANVRASLALLDTPPAYVTDAERGAGFVELAERLLAARASPAP
jgi:HAD superfamily hydrolase (TIGR01484 family)